MADIALRASLIAAALLIGACDDAQHVGARSSITVKLPPPRPAVPAPGFAFIDRETPDFSG